MFTLLISSFILFLTANYWVTFSCLLFSVFFFGCLLSVPSDWVSPFFRFFPHWNLMAPQVWKGWGKLWLWEVEPHMRKWPNMREKIFPQVFRVKMLEMFYVFITHVSFEGFKHDSQFTIVFSGQTLQKVPSLEILSTRFNWLLILRNLCSPGYIWYTLVPLETGPRDSK